MKAKQLRRLTAGIAEIFSAPPKPVIEQTVQLYFDGGCVDGRGYGSYQFVLHDKKYSDSRFSLGDQCTNNIAEWESLHRGIRAVQVVCDAKYTRLEVRGDSMLVVEGAAGRWKVGASHLKPIAARVHVLLADFAETDLQWWPRENSVRIFGH